MSLAQNDDLNVEVNGEEQAEQNQPVIHPRWYKMTDEDDLIPSVELMDGMIVQVADPERRATDFAILQGEEGYQWPYILRDNRWCTVSKLRRIGEDIVFIGIYEDGIKAIRILDQKQGFFVKKSSIPVPQEGYINFEQCEMVARDTIEFPLI